jgi:hypothetical protein
MTSVKRRLIAHIEIEQRTERWQVGYIDKGIVWHRKPLFLKKARVGSASELGQDRQQVLGETLGFKRENAR